jgi:hypothetical protein
MKTWFWNGMIAALIALPALSGVARADSDHSDGCTNATLKGEYAFGVTSYTPPNLPDGPPAVVAGIKVFDGKGNLTSVITGATPFRPNSHRQQGSRTQRPASTRSFPTAPAAW